jgi:2-hydroxy-3-keto-5-methylthiopentenyl-1-phosphate phosphatase
LHARGDGTKCYESAVPGARVVVDWDGTVTEIDGLHLVLLEFGDEDVYEEHESRLGHDLTLREVIAGEFLTVRAPLDEVVRWMRDNARVREGFASFAGRYEPLVVSSGFHELIEPVLEREGLELEVRANGLDPRPDGWRVLFREQAECAVCGERCKRSDLSDLTEFTYVGDGYSDRCVAEVATRVFARDGLAAYLAGKGFPFEPFDDFYDVARALEGEAVVPPGRSRGRNT